ncbi:MAG: 4Fe-4S binding protein [Thermoplasmatales archaeon]|nr:MAG: 4Fe-4S binding protein [Thermoplasmatales archaeon]
MSVEIHIINERCKGCKICVEVCQADVLDIDEKPNTSGYNPPCVKTLEDCTICGLCEMLCPDFAIRVSCIEGENKQ